MFKCFAFRPLLAFFLSLFLISFANAQNLSVEQSAASDNRNGTVFEARVTGLPELPQATVVVTPEYRFFYVFGDGSFYGPTKDSVVEHQFAPYFVPASSPVTSGQGSETLTFQNRAYVTSIYTGGDRPEEPDENRMIIPINDFDNVRPTPSIPDDGGYLFLRHHETIVPKDTVVIVNSFKSPFTADDSFFDGYALLLYESKLRIKEAKEKDNGRVVEWKEPVGQTAKYASFKYKELFNPYEPQGSDWPGYIRMVTPVFPVPSELGDLYQKAALFKIDSLPAGRDFNLYLELVNNEAMNANFTGEQIAEMDFELVLFSQTDAAPTSSDFGPEDRGRYVELKLATLLNQINEEFANSLGDQTLSTNMVIDNHIMTAELRKSHDPNFLKASTCECNSNEYGKKVFVTVQFENAGLEATQGVQVKIPIPEGIDPSSIAREVTSITPDVHGYGPGQGYDGLSVDFAADTMVVSFPNLQLMGVPEYGYGHPFTYSQFSFYALTEAGFPVNDIDSLYACIVFDYTASGQSPVCTTPVKIENVQSSANLICDACEPGCQDCIQTNCNGLWNWLLNCAPWWVWLIIGLLALILLLFLLGVFRRP